MNILTKYGRSKHFIERAVERFNLSEDQLDEFLANQGELRDTQLSPQPNRRNLLSEKGILFVVDDTNQVLVTCYASIPPHVFDETKEDFTKQLNNLIWQAELAEAKRVMAHLQPTLSRFVENIKEISEGELTEENHTRLMESYEYAAVIKYTFNMMGKHAKYYQEHRPLESHPILLPVEDKVKAKAPSQAPVIIRKPLSNSQILGDKTPLRDVMKPEDKQRINHWFMSQQRPQLASQALSDIKSGATKTELLSRLKGQLPIVALKKFEQELNKILGGH